MKQMLVIIENCYMCKWHGIYRNDKNQLDDRCSNFDFPETRLIENPEEIPSWCELEDYRKVDVNIIYNYDIGEWLWSVEVIDSDEFWLDSFPTKEEAIEYCNKYGLKIIDIVYKKRRLE